ncbi:MAG: hypothetical protein H7339_17510 [Arcicella sp.]|nr:hypothetical protein [Arcicella sp.]
MTKEMAQKWEKKPSEPKQNLGLGNLPNRIFKQIKYSHNIQENSLYPMRSSHFPFESML